MSPYQEYPCVRYHPEHGKRLVPNADKNAELGPGWVDTPAKFGVEPAAVAADPSSVDAAPVTPPATDDAARDAAEAAALHAASVSAIVKKLAGASVAVLERVKVLEAQNPKGARKGVLKAVDEALKKHAAK